MLTILDYIKVKYLFHVFCQFIFLFSAIPITQELSIYHNFVKVEEETKT